ncbi:MAG TPA: SRPBCC family protein [Pirellulaceae bacterium]|nr:SRPBCC family protein [Pirellulaceae bacterium]
MSHTYTLERTQLIRRPLDEVFEFFSDAGNLEAITPAFLNFRILTPRPIAMQPGTLIDYQIRLLGIPLSWRTQIETWEPPLRFSDVQLTGPYKLWHHTHEFVAVPEGTLMTDRVRYQMPTGPLGRVVHALWTRRTLEKIFDYRFEKIEELLEPLKAVAVTT